MRHASSFDDGLDLHQLAERITQDKADAYRWESAAKAAEDPDKRRELLRRARVASTRVDDAQARAAELFGHLRGWKLARRAFNLRTLAQGKSHDGRGWSNEHSAGQYRAIVDHPQYYRIGQYTAAIVAHNYGGPTGAAELAHSYGLILETPDIPSWYLPGGTRLVVYVGPRGVA